MSDKAGKIFIGGLSYETTDGNHPTILTSFNKRGNKICKIDKLRTYFTAYGTVIDAVVMKDPISRRSRGFGFITYADLTCVDKALAQPNHVLDNRRVREKRRINSKQFMHVGSWHLHCFFRRPALNM